MPLGEFERCTGYLRQAEGLARTLDDQRRLGRTSAYMCLNLWNTGHPREALAFGQNAQTIAKLLGDVALQVMADLHLGAACMWVGEYRRAEDLLLKVLRLAEGGLSRGRRGPEARSAERVHSFLTLIFAWQGRFEEGIVHGEEGIRLAQALDDPNCVANACLCLANLEITRGEFSRAFGLLERVEATSWEWNLTVYSEQSTARRGYAYALLGRTAEGIPLLEQALSASEAMRHGVTRPLILMFLGEAYALADRLEDAREFAGRALTLARECDQRPHEAWALRVLGEVTARRDPPDDAEGHYRGALALAEQFGMRPLLAHCHFGLGKLYRGRGTRGQARKHLTTAATLYRAMDMPFWLEQAEAEMPRAQ